MAGPRERRTASRRRVFAGSVARRQRGINALYANSCFSVNRFVYLHTALSFDRCRTKVSRAAATAVRAAYDVYATSMLIHTPATRLWPCNSPLLPPSKLEGRSLRALLLH